MNYRKRVYKYHNNHLVQVYNSINECAIAHKCSASLISMYCSGKARIQEPNTEYLLTPKEPPVTTKSRSWIGRLIETIFG